MMTLEQIEVELEKNEHELTIALIENNMLRAFELKLQRDLLKNEHIEILKKTLNQKRAA